MCSQSRISDGCVPMKSTSIEMLASNVKSLKWLPHSHGFYSVSCRSFYKPDVFQWGLSLGNHCVGGWAECAPENHHHQHRHQHHQHSNFHQLDDLDDLLTKGRQCTLRRHGCLPGLLHTFFAVSTIILWVWQMSFCAWHGLISHWGPGRMQGRRCSCIFSSTAFPPSG